MDQWTLDGQKLTDIEQRLVDAFEDGHPLVLGPNIPFTSEEAAAWEPERHIRAALIRDLLRGKHTTKPDPNGIQLYGAHITGGQLNLNNIDTTSPLTLAACYLPRGITAEGAELRTLELANCLITNSVGPALAADGLKISQVICLDGGTFCGYGRDGAVRLLGARIEGQLDLTHAILTNLSGPALSLDGTSIESSAFFTGGTFTGNGERGAVRLPGARIKGQLNLHNVNTGNPDGPAVVADSITVEGDANLEGGRFVGTGHAGSLRLLGGRITGQLNLENVTASNNAGPAIVADGMTVTGIADFRGALCTGNSESGTVRLTGSHFEAQLNLHHVSIANDRGAALVGSTIRSGSASFEQGAFTGFGPDGAIRLLDAHIAGQLNLENAQVINPMGPALTADGIIVDSDVILQGSTLAGRYEEGTLRLFGAQIGGQLNLRQAHVTNPVGPALAADAITVKSETSFEGASVKGSEHTGAVTVRSARFGPLWLDQPSLSSARSSSDRWAIDGATYTSMPNATQHNWLDFLGEGTTEYSAQPYQHLAAHHQAAGHDNLARKTLIAQREDQIERADMGKWSRRWTKFTGLTLGYGYQPWRALIGLLIVVTIAVGGCLFTPSALEQPATPNVAAARCDWAPRVAYALNTTIPLINTPTPCQPTNTPKGTTVYTTGWVLTLTAYSLLTLFIAGFTNAIRKT